MESTNDPKLDPPQTTWWKNPAIISPIVVAIITGVFALIVAGVNRSAQPTPPKDPPAASGDATTSGAKSPANTGSGNSFVYGDTSKKPK